MPPVVELDAPLTVPRAVIGGVGSVPVVVLANSAAAPVVVLLGVAGDLVNVIPSLDFSNANNSQYLPGVR